MANIRIVFDITISKLIIFATKREKSMNILLLIGGLILILLGANGLTDGAASVAKRFHIPPIVIGLTIVAFGTSAPELTVSVSSALKGSADIAIGNVVGSNIFNTLMIVGCTALFAPIVITRNTLRKEIPLCILSSIVLLFSSKEEHYKSGCHCDGPYIRYRSTDG